MDFEGNVKIYEAFKDVKESDVIIFVTHAPAYFNNAKKISKPHLLVSRSSAWRPNTLWTIWNL